MSLGRTAPALGIAAIVSAAPGARADVIYTFKADQTFSYAGQSLTPQVRLDITDAAVASGGFHLSGQQGPPSGTIYLGDLGGFVSLVTTGLSASASSGLVGNQFNVSMLFDAAGDILSGRVLWAGVDDIGQIAGGQAISSGTYSSDFPGCGPSGRGGACGLISGTWDHTAITLAGDAGATPSQTGSPIPEPTSAALAVAALAGLIAVRRRG